MSCLHLHQFVAERCNNKGTTTVTITAQVYMMTAFTVIIMLPSCIPYCIVFGTCYGHLASMSERRHQGWAWGRDLGTFSLADHFKQVIALTVRWDDDGNMPMNGCPVFPLLWKIPVKSTCAHASWSEGKVRLTRQYSSVAWTSRLKNQKSQCQLKRLRHLPLTSCSLTVRIEWKENRLDLFDRRASFCSRFSTVLYSW
jgi:hypothetical protein